MAIMTMTEFATKIGVAYITVSRVYNNKPGVKEATRAFVVEQAEKLGFHPNTRARGLKMQKSFAIGMVTPVISTAYWGELLREIQRSIEPENYGLLVSPCSQEKGDTSRAIRFLLRQGVDAIIVSSNNCAMQDEREEILQLAKSNATPILLLVTRWDISPFAFVGNDVVADMNMACQHLLELGHTHISIMASKKFNPGSEHRIKGGLSALRARGLGKEHLTILHGGYGILDGETAAEEWLTMKTNRPTAIIASNDPASIGLYYRLQREGLRIPHDVSIIGYGYSSEVQYMRPALTAIAHPLQALAKATKDHLMRCIDHSEDNVVNITIPGHLVSGESCLRLTKSKL